MTEWYYSTDGRDRFGPASNDDMAGLQTSKQLRPDTLVWREGMSGWKPWHEMAHEVLGASANTIDFGLSATGVTTPAAVEDGAYRPYAVAESTPYAPPQARVQERNEYVAGGPVVYAGFWKRVAANIIDSFVTAVLSWIVQIPLLLFMGIGLGSLGSGADPFSSGASIAVMAFYYLISIAIPLLYFSWMHSSSLQASVGKLAVGIKLVRGDGHPITFWRAFGRYWAMMLSYLILFVGVIMAAFTDRKQALHDMICDTLVIDKHAFTEHPEWQRDELGVVTIVILSLGGLLFLGMIALFAIMGAAIFSSGIR